MRASVHAARWLIGIGLLHMALFSWYGRKVLGSVAAEGFWNTIDPVAGRRALFWALATGVFGLLLGQLALWVANQGKPLPAFLGWQLIAVTLLFGILMPFSGGCLFAVPGILIVLGARAPGRRGSKSTGGVDLAH